MFLIFVFLIPSLFHLASSIDCECGITKTSVRRRIVGGIEASPGDYPWIAALTDESGQTFCGGTLINSKFILTAAHCMVGRAPASFHVILGETDLSSPAPESLYSVSRIFIHPLYSGKPNFKNDLALVQLEQSIEFDTSSKSESFKQSPIGGEKRKLVPACLPQEGPHVYGTLLVTGWGLLSNRGRQPMKLQEAAVIQRSSIYCSSVYGPKFTANHICANSVRSDVCNGDSGGPLMLRTKLPRGQQGSKIFIVGVVSFGYVCGYAPYPAVFTRPTEYLKWIFSMTGTGKYCNK